MNVCSWQGIGFVISEVKVLFCKGLRGYLRGSRATALAKSLPSRINAMSPALALRRARSWNGCGSLIKAYDVGMYENRVALFGFERKGCPFSIDGSPMLMRWRDPFVDLRLQVQQERVETQPIDGKAIAAEAGRFSGFIRMDQLSKSASELLVI